MEPRRRRIRATYKQLNLLVKFMNDNPDLVRGVNYRTAFGKHYHDAKWMELANLLNTQENGMNKSPREWNRYWKDLKSGIKKKVHAMRKKQSRSKQYLSSIEQIIYKNMCNHKRRKNTVDEDKNCSYLQIPSDSDNEHDKYEVEYLEESSCDETQMTNVTDARPAENYIRLHHATVNDVKLELVDGSGQTLLDQDNILIDTILKSSHSATTVPKMEKDSQAAISNNVSINNNNNEETNTLADSDKSKTDVLIDIRNHLKELIAIQKDRVRSELRMAGAYERRAILEEKRVRIEERRVKIEERRVALEERKMEALEKKSFAHERLASAAERKNEITEHRMSNSDFVLR